MSQRKYKKLWIPVYFTKQHKDNLWFFKFLSKVWLVCVALMKIKCSYLCECLCFLWAFVTLQSYGMLLYYNNNVVFDKTDDKNKCLQLQILVLPFNMQCRKWERMAKTSTASFWSNVKKIVMCVFNSYLIRSVWVSFEWMLGWASVWAQFSLKTATMMSSECTCLASIVLSSVWTSVQPMVLCTVCCFVLTRIWK